MRTSYIQDIGRLLGGQLGVDGDNADTVAIGESAQQLDKQRKQLLREIYHKT